MKRLLEEAVGLVRVQFRLEGKVFPAAQVAFSPFNAWYRPDVFVPPLVLTHYP